jgi:hypothetical protein
MEVKKTVRVIEVFFRSSIPRILFLFTYGSVLTINRSTAMSAKSARKSNDEEYDR